MCSHSYKFRLHFTAQRLNGKLEMLHRLIQLELALFGPVIVCYLMEEDMQIYRTGTVRALP